METRVPRTLVEAIWYFKDPEVCFQLLKQIRWPDGVVKCPYCGTDQVHFLANQRRWKCGVDHPRRQFSAKVGTIFEDSPLGLDKWFAAMWMVANCKNGVSSYEIHRALGVTQKTAWFMDHRIRLAMQTNSFLKLEGEIEADESFIGGLARNMHKWKRAEKISGTGGAGKQVVMGLLDRHSKEVRVMHVADIKRETLQDKVREHVTRGSEVYTDALAAYTGLDAEYIHNVIDHAEAYAIGKVHTNGIENFWSLLKRGLKGTYVAVEPFHLFRYLDEQAFRYNNRKTDDGNRFVRALSRVEGKRVTYKKLTGKEETAAATT